MKKHVGMMGVVLSLALIAFADPVDKIEPSADPNLDINVDSLCDGVGSLVTNCGFEAGTYPPPGWTTFGDTSFTGVSGVYAYTGNFGLFAGPTGGPGGIFQNVPTTAGQTYALTFYLRNTLAPNSFSVSWNGTVLYSCTNCSTFPYTVFGFNQLMATGSTSEVRFSFYNPPDYFGLDDVIVVPCDQE